MNEQGKFELKIEDNCAVIYAHGKINGVTSRAFEITVDSLFDGDSKFEKLIFDFKDVDYISSSGLRVILYSKKKLSSVFDEEDDFCSRLVIRNATSEVKEILDMTGFDTIVDVK